MRRPSVRRQDGDDLQVTISKVLPEIDGELAKDATLDAPASGIVPFVVRVMRGIITNRFELPSYFPPVARFQIEEELQRFIGDEQTILHLVCG